MQTSMTSQDERRSIRRLPSLHAPGLIPVSVIIDHGSEYGLLGHMKKKSVTV
ncbi:hypothetical protein [Paenibacillus spongiae]|uniref:Uncharacterized protein n=1 Tax=Paenibacillus spongiae TaxID=2909671 RepID=A0ABY5SBI4_9BACL|nr:hypothetical protein [Paenibacillus spongiae]UVI31299.1 hypothetical protein L1F29_05500 [Paenibacillus spongiae]